MLSPKEKIYTVADIYNLPAGQRAELIDGRIYNMAPPSRIHQRIVLSLSRKLADYVEQNHKECEVDIAPFAVFLNKDDYNYLEPDVSVICDQSKLDDRGCNGSPDFIIEVVSPSTMRMDYLIKMRKYMTSGVRLYWIVNPQDESVTVYDFEHDEYGRYHFEEPVPVSICDGLRIIIGESV